MNAIQKRIRIAVLENRDWKEDCRDLLKEYEIRMLQMVWLEQYALGCSMMKKFLESRHA